MADTLPVRCPVCHRDYLLPRSLMGEVGARVRCPACSEPFVVSPAGEVAAAGAPAAPGQAPSPSVQAGAGAATTADARAHAAAALDALERQVGPALVTAAHERRLFRDHGAALLDAFDDYRRLAGKDAPTEVFRALVRERLGVELFPSGETR